MREARIASQRSVDPWLATVALLLAIAGLTVATSAREFVVAMDAGEPISMLRSSFAHLVVGMIGLGVAMLIDYRWLTQRRVLWLMLATVAALLIGVLSMSAVANTHRFIRFGGFGGFGLQPSELAKPILVLILAGSCVRAGESLRTASGLGRPLLLAAFLAALVLAGRDLGTPTLMFGVSILVLIAAGARWRHVLGLAGIGSAVFSLFVLLEDYRVQRILDYVASLRLDFAIMRDTAYQVYQSILAIGAGGVIGRGLGNSMQKAFYLPEAENDFVFAIISEEFGLVGALLLVVAFGVILWRGVAVAESAQDECGRLVALGASWMLGLQALIHMGVNLGLLPAKGLPLPFLSTGGSSLLSSCILVGLILNVSLRSHGERAAEDIHV